MTSSSGAPSAANAEVSERARAIHLLQRSTYGARAEDIASVLSLGADAWLDRQLHPERIQYAVAEERLARYPTVSLSMDELMSGYGPRQLQARLMMDSPGRPRPQTRQEMTPEMRQKRQQRSPARLLGDLVGAKLTRAVYSERQLEEVMTDFWFNHFNVYFAKGNTRLFVADYERAAIRPHVFGTFDELLLATAQHPAMLFYLDNATSVVPDSMNVDAQARRAQRGRARGLNENYARELMELHTLGVDGGYTQRDVVEVARALTGWTFANPNRPGFPGGPGGPLRARADAAREQPDGIAFVFRPEAHDRLEKAVLGTKLPAGRGIEDGLDVIHMLATQPSTAKFIAGKLVGRFVTDEPAPELVDELAQVFLSTGGDLREVTRALFTSPRFHDERYIGTKVKTPYELVASALRVTRAEVGPSRRLVETLRAMGNLPYSEPAPTGFPASSEDWVNSGAMLARMNFGLAVASNGLDGVRIDAAALVGASAPRTLGPADLPSLLDALLPGVPTEKLENGILRDLSAHTAAEPRASAARALGLIIGSPDFQKR